MTNQKNKLFNVVTIIIAAFMLWQCSRPGNEFSDFVTIDSTGWLYGDTLSLDMPDYAADSVATGALAVVVRHTNHFPYSNLWLEVMTPATDSTMRTDTVNVRMADVYGNWLGHGTGITYTLTDTVLDNVRLVKGRPARLRHIMRTDTLTEIDQIGITLIPNTIKR